MCSIVHPHPKTRKWERARTHMKFSARTDPRITKAWNSIQSTRWLSPKKIPAAMFHPETPWSFIIQVAKIIQKICWVFCIGNHVIFHPEKACFQNLGHWFFSRTDLFRPFFGGLFPSFPLATLNDTCFTQTGARRLKRSTSADLLAIIPTIGWDFVWAYGRGLGFGTLEEPHLNVGWKCSHYSSSNFFSLKLTAKAPENGDPLEKEIPVGKHHV